MQTIIINTPGPQGPQGPQGSPGLPADTSSLATTGSNVFYGDQTISNSVLKLDNGAIMNYNTQSLSLTIPTNYNALLVGPIYNIGSINISGTLLIL